MADMGRRMNDVLTIQSRESLHHGPFLKTFPLAAVLVSLSLFLSIKIFINPAPASPGDGALLMAGIVFIAIIPPWTIFLEAFGTVGHVSSEGLQMKSVWRGSRLIKWEDVETIYYSHWSPGIVVKAPGTSITLSDDLKGLSYFAETVIARLSPDKWEKVSGRILILAPKGQFD